MITSGSASNTSYGRGDVTDKSTVFNMKAVNPIKDPDAPEMDTYCSDGSYNQDVWGYKCFNGPVSFRNGIYGEFGSLTTLSELSSDDYEAPKGGIELRVPAVDKDGVNTNSSLKLFYHDYHREGDEDRYQQTSSMLSASGYDRSASIEAYVSDDQEGVRIIGHGCSIASDVTEISSHTYPSGLGRRGGISLVARDTDDNRISSIEVANNITTKGSIIPKEDLADDIGDNDHKFNNLYVNSIVTSSLSTGSAANLQSINVSGNSTLSNTSITEDLSISGNLSVGGCTTLSDDTIITGDLAVSGLVSAERFSQDFVEVHKLNIVNKLDEDTGDIELGELTCHGCIKTYNYIEPVVIERKLIPTPETITALENGYGDYHTSNEVRNAIKLVLNNETNVEGLELLNDDLIDHILDDFSNPNDYEHRVDRTFKFTSDIIKVLTSTPIENLGIGHICDIEPPIVSTGMNIDCRIGLEDLNNSYDGFFNNGYFNEVDSREIHTRTIKYNYIDPVDVINRCTADISFYTTQLVSYEENSTSKNCCITTGKAITEGEGAESIRQTYYNFTDTSFYPSCDDSDPNPTLGDPEHYWSDLYVENIHTNNDSDSTSIEHLYVANNIFVDRSHYVITAIPETDSDDCWYTNSSHNRPGYVWSEFDHDYYLWWPKSAGLMSLKVTDITGASDFTSDTTYKEIYDYDNTDVKAPFLRFKRGKIDVNNMDMLVLRDQGNSILKYESLETNKYQITSGDDKFSFKLKLLNSTSTVTISFCILWIRTLPVIYNGNIWSSNTPDSNFDEFYDRSSSINTNSIEEISISNDVVFQIPPLFKFNNGKYTFNPIWQIVPANPLTSFYASFKWDDNQIDNLFSRDAYQWPTSMLVYVKTNSNS